MVGEDIISEILVYLKKAGPTNTFRLSSIMGLERDKLLHILKRLEEKEAIRFECGNAAFLKFVSGEKPRPKAVKIEKSPPRPSTKVKRKPAKPRVLQLLQTENKQLQEKLSELKETVKELEQKAVARPKTITRTVIKTIIKKVPVIKTVVKRIPVPLLPKKERKIKEKPKAKKFEFPKKFPKFTFMKNIKQLKKPEFVK